MSHVSPLLHFMLRVCRPTRLILDPASMPSTSCTFYSQKGSWPKPFHEQDPAVITIAVRLVSKQEKQSFISNGRLGDSES